MMARCICGRMAPRTAIEPTPRTDTGDRGWIVALHTCACGETFREAHDTQGRMAAAAERATDNPLPGAWAR